MTITDIIKSVQRAVGVKDDGVAGTLTWNAIAKALDIQTDSELHNPPVAYLIDARSTANIGTLLPQVQPIARELLAKLNQQMLVGFAKIIDGSRTYEEQDRLYGQGRSKPGRIVTNARAGYSNHNFGIAFDIGIFSNNGSYLGESAYYDLAGDIGKALGLQWGGDWTSFEDKPHFEWRPTWAVGLSENAMLAELRARKSKGHAIA